MDALNRLTAKLKDTISQESDKPVEMLAGFIVGELLGDYDGIYEGLREKYPDVERIGDLASGLEWSNGSPKQLEDMWTELKDLVAKL